MTMLNESEGEARPVAEALSRVDTDDWRKAIESELQSHKVHATWVIVRKRKDVNPLSTRCVLLRKFD